MHTFEITNLLLKLNNYWLWVTDRKRKIDRGLSESHRFFNKNMGSLGDSGAENGGLNSPTYVAPPKWECPRALEIYEIFVSYS